MLWYSLMSVDAVTYRVLFQKILGFYYVITSDHHVIKYVANRRVTSGADFGHWLLDQQVPAAVGAVHFRVFVGVRDRIFEPEVPENF